MQNLQEILRRYFSYFKNEVNGLRLVSYTLQSRAIAKVDWGLTRKWAGGERKHEQE